LATGQAQPVRIVIDDCFVYWSNSLGGAIMRAEKSGGTPQPVTPATQPGALAVDKNRVYWVQNGMLTSAPKAGGGSATPLLPANAQTVWGIDDDFVYLSSRVVNYDTLRRYPKGSTTSDPGFQFVGGQFWGFGLDDTEIYIYYRAPSSFTFSVFLLTKAAQSVANVDTFRPPFGSDGDFLYSQLVAAGAVVGIGGIPKCGGPAAAAPFMLTAQIDSSVRAFATASGFVYYATNSRIRRVGALGTPRTIQKCPQVDASPD
jgi:hypothetical protein